MPETYHTSAWVNGVLVALELTQAQADAWIAEYRARTGFRGKLGWSGHVYEATGEEAPMPEAQQPSGKGDT